jgi:hypothetical protein
MQRDDTTTSSSQKAATPVRALRLSLLPTGLAAALTAALLVIAFFVAEERVMRRKRATLDLGAIAGGIDLFQSETGTLPVSLSELVPHYLKEVHKDPWGNDYVYKRVGSRASEDYLVLSLGRDGRLGTDDDIRITHSRAASASK